jgi:hypothetical protein
MRAVLVAQLRAAMRLGASCHPSGHTCQPFGHIRPCPTWPTTRSGQTEGAAVTAAPNASAASVVARVGRHGGNRRCRPAGHRCKRRRGLRAKDRQVGCCVATGPQAASDRRRQLAHLDAHLGGVDPDASHRTRRLLAAVPQGCGPRLRAADAAHLGTTCRNRSDQRTRFLLQPMSGRPNRLGEDTSREHRRLRHDDVSDRNAVRHNRSKGPYRATIYIGQLNNVGFSEARYNVASMRRAGHTNLAANKAVIDRGGIRLHVRWLPGGLLLHPPDVVQDSWRRPLRMARMARRGPQGPGPGARVWPTPAAPNRIPSRAAALCCHGGGAVHRQRHNLPFGQHAGTARHLLP